MPALFGGESLFTKARFLVFILSAAWAASAAAQTTYQIDPAHSAANFTVRHMMVSNVHGQFTGLKGALALDDKDVTKSKVDATVDTNTVNTGTPGRDADLRSPNFFDVVQFPTMSFHSTKVEKASDGKLRVTGDLTMHGVTKPVTFEVDGPMGPVKGMGGTRVGFTATTKINRKDFGINWNKMLDNGGAVVSDEVSIELDAEFVNRGQESGQQLLEPEKHLSDGRGI